MLSCVQVHSHSALIFHSITEEEDDGLADLLKEADDVLADLCQAHNDIVGVDVAEGGVVPALPPGLGQQQVPAVYRGQKVLVFPEELKKKCEEWLIRFMVMLLQTAPAYQ